MVSRLRDEEEHFGVLSRLKRPRALIVLPSRDLAAQVLRVAKSLCHTAKFKAVGLIGGIRRVGNVHNLSTVEPPIKDTPNKRHNRKNL